MATVGDVRNAVHTAYPPHLAESWDAVGLICGDPADEVTKVAFALDCTQAVADAAVAAGAQMLVVHHPLLLRGVTTVAADTPKGRVIHTLIRGGVALLAAHTNADKARPGVNDRLAELVGITPGRPIVPVDSQVYHHWGVHVPADAAAAVKDAVFAAGAGAVGNYTECAFEFSGRGQFRPQPGATPAAGSIGELEHVEELRVEFVAPSHLRGAIEDALHAAHPYEVPAFDVTEMVGGADLEHALGLGRIGELPQPLTLREFTQQVANALPETAWGVRAAGDPDRLVRRVAVSSGSGDSFLADAARLGADVYVTSDLRHHPVDETLRAHDIAVIDTAHWASEFPWTSQVRDIVEQATGVNTEIIDLRTDPWTVSAHKEN